jgi:hypothetical protein
LPNDPAQVDVTKVRENVAKLGSPSEISSQIDGQNLGRINGGDSLVHTPRDTAQDLPNKLNRECLAKERDEDLTSAVSLDAYSRIRS